MHLSAGVRKVLTAASLITLTALASTAPAMAYGNTDIRTPPAGDVVKIEIAYSNYSITERRGQEPILDRAPQQASQQWVRIAAGIADRTEYFTLRNRMTGECLTAEGAATHTESGTRVITVWCDGRNSQKWSLHTEGSETLIANKVRARDGNQRHLTAHMDKSMTLEKLGYGTFQEWDTPRAEYRFATERTDVMQSATDPNEYRCRDGYRFAVRRGSIEEGPRLPEVVFDDSLGDVHDGIDDQVIRVEPTDLQVRAVRVHYSAPGEESLAGQVWLTCVLAAGE